MSHYHIIHTNCLNLVYLWLTLGISYTR